MSYYHFLPSLQVSSYKNDSYANNYSPKVCDLRNYSCGDLYMAIAFSW